MNARPYTIEDKLADIVESAYAYVTARERLAAADSAGQLAAVIEVDRAWHDLTVSVTGRCGCDPDTCPRRTEQ